MRWNKVLITLKKELRSILRDKKSLMMMLLLPFIIPTFIFIFGYIYDSSNEKIEDSTYEIGLNYDLNEVENEFLDSSIVNVHKYESLDKMKEAYNNDEISAFVYKIEEKYTVYANNYDEDSIAASSAIYDYLSEYNNFLGTSYITSNGLDPYKAYSSIIIDSAEVKGNNNMLVETILTMGFTFAFMSVVLSAVYSATDLTAGEKEHGTLETLLTFPIRSSEIIIGKYLAVVSSCVLTAILSVLLSFVSMYGFVNWFKIAEGYQLNITLEMILIALLILCMFALFVSGVAIAIASFSKTYKEAQSSLTPLSLVVMAPMFLEMMEIELTPFICMIPFVGPGLLINEVLLGNINYLNVLSLVLSSIVFIVLIIIYISKQYKSEKVLFSI